MKTLTMKRIDFKTAYHALLGIRRSIRNMHLWQRRIFWLLTLALTWIVSGRYTQMLLEPKLLIAEATLHPVVEEVVVEEELTEPEVVSRADADAVARVLYGIRNNDDKELSAVVWCIISRCESALYPSTIVEVCEQPSQWMGYSSENPVLSDLYEIAYEALYTWETGGHRPFGPEYLWFSWTPDQITFRTSFEESRGCKYWRAS